jgi:hypothetical protein
MAKASPFGVARWRLQGRCRTKSPNADTFEHHLFRVFRLPSGSPIPYGVEVSLWPIELFGTRLQTPLCASTFPGFRLGLLPLAPSATRTIKHGTGEGVKRYLLNIAFDRRTAFGLYVGSGIGPRGEHHGNQRRSYPHLHKARTHRQRTPQLPGSGPMGRRVRKRRKHPGHELR